MYVVLVLTIIPLSKNKVKYGGHVIAKYIYWCYNIQTAGGVYRLEGEIYRNIKYRFKLPVSVKRTRK